MKSHRRHRRFVSIAALLVCLAFVGCKHVEFERGTSPINPSVIPGAGNRFKLNFTVINPTDNDYPVGTFRVDAHTTYTTAHKICTKDHTWTLPYLPKKTGKIVIADFELDPDAFSGEGCNCFKDQCSGGLLLTLKWNSGPDTGKKVKGGNTKLNIAWAKDGDPSNIVITDHGG